MIKKNNSNNGKVTIVIFITLMIGVLLLVFNNINGNTEEVNIKDKPRENLNLDSLVDNSGYCQGKEGESLSICCAKWDNKIGKEVWVMCDDLLSNEDEQAFFKFGQSETLKKISSVMFTIMLHNQGNTNAGVKLSDVEVKALEGGDQNSISNIKNSFDSLKNIFEDVGPGDYSELKMNQNNRIKIDIPEGSEQYQMKDGIYEITLTIQIENENGDIVDGGSRTIMFEVEQERVQFSIEVQTI